MLKIDIIYYKIKNLNLALLFILAMAKKNITSGNISVFKYSNINQIGLLKYNFRFNECF